MSCPDSSPSHAPPRPTSDRTGSSSVQRGKVSSLVRKGPGAGVKGPRPLQIRVVPLMRPECTAQPEILPDP